MTLLLFIVGLLAQIWPLGLLIDRILKRWISVAGGQHEDVALNAPFPARLSRYIGILERLIIFSFIWFGAFEATSFVIAGKAILRFREANQERHSEYILVGTLLSAACAILTGIGLSKLADWLAVCS